MTISTAKPMICLYKAKEAYLCALTRNYDG